MMISSPLPSFLFLTLVPFAVIGFQHHHPYPSICRKNNHQRHGLYMGGYTSDLEKEGPDPDLSNTHMIFGVRCVEDVIWCSIDTSITNLRPIIDPATSIETDDDDDGEEGEGGDDREDTKDDDGDDEQEPVPEQPYRESDTSTLSQQYLVKYLLTPDIGDDVYSKPELKDKRIMQIGCGGTALALAQYGGCSNVLVVDTDETRLQIIEHAFEHYNKPTDTRCELETMILEPKDAFPKCDVIILSTEDEDWINAALETDRTRTVLFEGAY